MFLTTTRGESFNGATVDPFTPARLLEDVAASNVEVHGCVFNVLCRPLSPTQTYSLIIPTQDRLHAIGIHLPALWLVRQRSACRNSLLHGFRRLSNDVSQVFTKQTIYFLLFNYLWRLHTIFCVSLLYFCERNSRPRVLFGKLNIHTIHSSSSFQLIKSQWSIAIGCDVTFEDSGTGQDSAQFSEAYNKFFNKRTIAGVLT